MPPPFAPLYPTHAPPPFQRPQPTQAKRKASAQSLSNESPASKRGRTPGGSSPSTRNTRQRDRSETPSRPGGSNEPLVAEKEESSGHWKSYVTPDGTRTAEDFIVEWLTEGTNYASYKVSKPKGKEAHGELILNRIREAGIPITKKPSMVVSKIRTIVEAWKTAHQNLNQTGNGSTDSDLEDDETQDQEERQRRWGKKQERAAFMTKFNQENIYYQTLAPVLGSRTVNAPRTLLDSINPSNAAASIEDRLGIAGDHLLPPQHRSPTKPSSSSTIFNEIEIANVGRIEDTPEYQEAFGLGSETQTDDDLANGISTPASSSLRQYIASPSNSLASVSTRAGTVDPISPRKPTTPAIRDPTARATAMSQQPRTREKKGDDMGMASLAAVMEQRVQSDRENAAADQQWRKDKAEREEKERVERREMEQRRIAKEEKEQQDRNALEQRRLDFEIARFEQEKQDREAERTQQTAKMEAELLQQKMKAFQELRTAGLGTVDALKAAGLSGSSAPAQ
ncbi:hypothetical protein HD553DRAFT_345301 [Filobasidium floriforme]|uniref:uncharacterized protein n=1 Tax=Filobasidium floriforme TaxID=5210 RepID=UPI001E8D43D3|nr:uncharacterized protein HD553DRAFT_345301 [Filobasidium floriforme]KAH8079970.1 hypothetical protein HD553DRAFT_345301 [Filobasidium floriforme]